MSPHLRRTLLDLQPDDVVPFTVTPGAQGLAVAYRETEVELDGIVEYLVGRGLVPIISYGPMDLGGRPGLAYVVACWSGDGPAPPLWPLPRS